MARGHVRIPAMVSHRLLAAPVILLPAFCGTHSAAAELQPQARGPGGIVAIVNQDVITRGELDRQVALRMEDVRLGQDIPVTALERERARIERAMLDWLIEQALLLQDAKKNKITTSEAEIDADITRRIEKDFRPKGLNVQDAEELYKFLKETYNYSREEYRDQVRHEILINRLLWTKYFLPPFVTPGEAREYYHSHPEEFETDSDYSFYMITVDNNEDAVRVIEALNVKMKKQPFLEVAREFAAAQGQEVILWKKKAGELREWRQPLPDVIQRMKPGEVQGPIRTVNGYRYLQMVEIKAGTRKSFDEAQAHITASIRLEHNIREKTRLVNRLKKEAHLQDFLPPLAPQPVRPVAAPAPTGPEPPPGKLKDASPEPAAPKKN